jgi:hypothetical protein
MPDPLLQRADFNALATKVFDNNYGQDSGAVLRADLHQAMAQGDEAAVRSIQRDLARTGNNVAGNSNNSGDASNIPDTSTSPAQQPEARSALNAFTTLSPELESAIFSGEKDRAAASGRAATALRSSADAQASSIQLGAEADASTEQLHNELLRAVGLDVRDPSSFLSTELQHQATVRHARESIDSRIASLEGLSFWQNPFAFLSAQPELKQLTAQYNNLAAQENSSSEEINRLQSVADSVMKMTPAKNADLLRKKAVADATAVVQAANAKAEEYTAQNAAGHAKAMMDVFTMKHNIFQSVLQVQTLEEGVQDRRQRQTDLNFWRGIKDQEGKDKLAAKQEADNQELALAVAINTYRTAINGTANIPLTQKDIKLMPAEMRKEWYDVAFRGNYGNSYQESVPFIEQKGNMAAAAQAGNASMMQVVRNLQIQARQMAPEIANKVKLKNIMVNVKPEQALQMAYDELYTRDAGAAIAGGDKSNISAASPLAIDFDAAAAVAKASPGGVNNVVSKALLAAKERAQGRPLNSSYTAPMLLNEVEARVVSGETTPKQAADELARFIALQSANSYIGNGLKYLNIPQPTDWMITPGAKGKERVDLMNPTKLENYFTSKVARAKAGAAFATRDMDPSGSSNLFNTGEEFIPKGRTK